MITATYKLSVDWDGSGNSVSNGDFESDVSGWLEAIDSGITATTGQTTDESKVGFGSEGSLEIDVTASANTGRAQRFHRSDAGTAAPGESWGYEVWIKGDSFTNARAEVTFNFNDSAGNVLQVASTKTTTDVSGDFIHIGDSGLVAPANTSRIQINVMVRVTTSGGTGKAWFDLVRAEKDSGDNEDVTDDLVEVHWSRGRDYQSQLAGKYVSLDAVCILNNFDGQYSSFATSTVKPGRKVRLQATDSIGTTTLFEGYLMDIIPRPDISGLNQAEFIIVGPLGFVNDRTIEVAMETSILTGAAVGKVLDQLDWPDDMRFLADGQITMTRWWVDKQLTFSALQEIEDTELGFLWETRNGKIGFDDSQTRLDTTFQTSQATFSDASGATLPYMGIEVPSPIPYVYNIAETDVQLYTVDSLAVLWTLAEDGASSPSIEAGESKVYWARYPNPASNAQGVAVDAWTTPVASTDYTVNTAADGSGTDITSDVAVVVEKFAQRMKITLTNNNVSDGFITLLQARGTPVLALDPVPIREEADETNLKDYGERSFPYRPRFIPTTQAARDWGKFILATSKEPVSIPVISFLANRSADLMDAALRLDIRQRITLVANNRTNLGINRDFFIEAEEHHINQFREHRVTYRLTDALRFSDFWILDFSELGETTRLAA